MLGTFCAIDFETTGAVEDYPVEPWQVGVVVWTPGDTPVLWESTLRVGPRPFHPNAPGRHAQIRAELEQSPSLSECLPRLRQLCGGRPLVAHNAATELACFRREVPLEAFGPWVDTLKLARAAWPLFPSHSLEALLEGFKLTERVLQALPGRAPHDALYDALGSAVLLDYLLSCPGWSEATPELLMHPDQQAYYQSRKPRRRLTPPAGGPDAS